MGGGHDTQQACNDHQDGDGQGIALVEHARGHPPQPVAGLLHHPDGQSQRGQGKDGCQDPATQEQLAQAGPQKGESGRDQRRATAHDRAGGGVQVGDCRFAFQSPLRSRPRGRCGLRRLCRAGGRSSGRPSMAMPGRPASRRARSGAGLHAGRRLATATALDGRVQRLRRPGDGSVADANNPPIHAHGPIIRPGAPRGKGSIWPCAPTPSAANASSGRGPAGSLTRSSGYPGRTCRSTGRLAGSCQGRSSTCRPS